MDVSDEGRRGEVETWNSQERVQDELEDSSYSTNRVGRDGCHGPYRWPNARSHASAVAERPVRGAVNEVQPPEEAQQGRPADDDVGDDEDRRHEGVAIEAEDDEKDDDREEGDVDEGVKVFSNTFRE